MTPEEKELLLKDLSARIPYQPLCKITDTEYDFCECDGPLGYSLRDFVGNNIIIKPYLRPMNSMTSQEWCELCDCNVEDDKAAIFIKDGRRFVSHVNQETFLNSHHFDYRGLIPMGLALEAPKDMYKTE